MKHSILTIAHKSNYYPTLSTDNPELSFKTPAARQFRRAADT